MNSLKDREYYAVRAAAALQMATRAENRQIAAIHHDLAVRYAQIALEKRRDPILALQQTD